MNRIRTVFFFLMFAGIGYHAVSQEMITVTPKEYTSALTNPLKGFRPDLQRATSTNSPYTTIVRHYIKWNEVEQSAEDDYTKLVDFADKHWSHLPALNIRVIPRIYVDWDNRSGNEYWPADILQVTGLEPDDPRLWRTQIVKERLVNLVHKMGKAWNQDPRIAWVQTGLVGYWGEQENPVGVDEESYAQLLGDAFSDAFPNKMLVVRNQKHWDNVGHEWGVYWDSYGHPGQRNGAWADLQRTTAQRRYLTQVVEGEVAYNWGESVFDPVYGGEPTITLGNDRYSDNMVDVIHELHASGLGWIADYDVNGKYGTDPNIVRANADKMQKAFGYRFHLSAFSCSARTTPDRTLNLNFKVKNKGSAPLYGYWPVAVVLVDEHTKEIVWKEVLSNIDPSTWEPGSNYNYETKAYQTPATKYTYSQSVTLPDSIPKGEYLIGLTILEPYSQSPGVFFAVENFVATSQTQPLMRVGVGVDVIDDHAVKIMFDDPVINDSRYYTLLPKGSGYSLSSGVAITNPSDETESLSPGTIKPPSGYFAENSTVILRAVPQTGFEFAGWEGDLSGMTNPQSLLMDADRSVLANFRFVGLPNYADSILSFVTPKVVFPGEKVKLAVECEVSQVRDIRVFIQLNSEPWTTYGSFTKTVAEGAFNEDLYLTVSSLIPPKVDGYKFVANLLPLGGSWPDRLDEKIQIDVDAVLKTISVDSVSLSSCPVNDIVIGDQHQLIATVYPGNASDKTIFWESSNPSVVSVDSKGLITAHNSGKVRITVKSANNAFKNSCLVNAVPPVPLAFYGSKGTNIYPNPVSDFLTIEFPEESPKSIRVFNLVGQELYQLSTTDSQIQMDFKHIDVSGPVLLCVESELFAFYRRIIVDKGSE